MFVYTVTLICQLYIVNNNNNDNNNNLLLVYFRTQKLLANNF